MIDMEAFIITIFVTLLAAVLFSGCAINKVCEIECDRDEFNVPICQEVCR